MSQLCKASAPSDVDLAAVVALLTEELQFLSNWEIAIALLPERDPVTEFYRIEDVALVLGVRRHEQVQRLARELWPRRRRCAGNGNYRLTIEEAAQLIRAYVFRGKIADTRDEMAGRLAQRVFLDFRRRFRLRSA